MKKILYMLLAVMMTAFTACREKDEVQHRIVGEWHFAEEEAGQQIEIYIAFNSNFTFDLYQKIGEGVFGKSITDPCIGWEKTEKLVLDIADLI